MPSNNVTSNYGPICYDCLHGNNSGSCTTKMRCYQGDVCLVFRDQYGLTQRCMSKQNCQNGLSTSTADCWNCCDTDLCNIDCPVVTTATIRTCKDDVKCSSFQKLAAYYNVCADPVYSSTICKKKRGRDK